MMPTHACRFAASDPLHECHNSYGPGLPLRPGQTCYAEAVAQLREQAATNAVAELAPRVVIEAVER